MHRRRDLLRRFCLALALIGARAARAQMPDLIATLSARLGVTEEQAARGGGAVFWLAEQRLSPAGFSIIAGSCPGSMAWSRSPPRSPGRAAGSTIWPCHSR